MAELVQHQRTSERPAFLRGGRSFRVSAHRRFVRYPVIVGFLAALPVILHVVRAVGWGARPTGDHAIIALRAFDVLSRRSPELGQATSASMGGVELGHSPGPMLYWLHAFPARWGPAWAPTALAGAVTVACFVAATVLADRRGGPVLSSATALGLCLTARAVEPWYLATTWNPGAPLAPFVLVLFLAWAIADGEQHLLPVLVVVASFVVQCHLAFLLPVALVSAVAVLGGFGRWAWTLVRRRGGDRRPARPLVLSVCAAVVCWALPVLDQLTNRPGNAVVLYRSTRGLEDTLGVQVGARAVGQAVGLPPRFLRPQSSDDVTYGYLATPTRVSAVFLVVLAAAALVGGTAAWRRRDRTVVSGLVLSAALALGAVLVVSKVPGDDVRFLTIIYTLLWLVPAGLFAWLAIGLALGRVVVAHHVGRTLVRPWGRARSPGSARVGATGVAVVLVVVGTLVRTADADRWSYGPGRVLGDAAADAVAGGGTYLVSATAAAGPWFEPVVAYRVRRAGADVMAHDQLAGQLGPAYRRAGERCVAVLRVEARVGRRYPPPVDGQRVLATVELGDARPPYPSGLRLVQVPDRGAPSC